MLTIEDGFWIDDFIFQGDEEIIHTNVDYIDDWAHIWEDIWYIHPFPDVDITLIALAFNPNVVNGYMLCSNINSLPNNLYVNGHLDLRESGISGWPKKLTVKGILDIRDTELDINELPPCASVDAIIVTDKGVIHRYDL
jgi:hypothetical protein